ncbi:MAG TPA: allantoinase AllB [Pyrinomonadaceae bacterium]|nr:allantoinase AllB [Pyrinomonadaceae bacterium]
MDLIIRGQSVVLPQRIEPAAIHVREGRIVSITDYDQIDSGSPLVEAKQNEVVMAGLVDTHVHINSPGRSDWEGFPTATKAAAAGGTTTVIDMPLNSIPPTTTTEGFETKLSVARNNCFVDVGFWGGVVPGNTSELRGLKEAGVVGFKCFLVPSGVDEFPNVTEEDLRVAMPELTRLDSLLIVHAELPGPIDHATPSFSGPPSTYAGFLHSRPRSAENLAVELMVKLSREFETRVHIVHLSSSDALSLLKDARASGVRISAETCPHYLHLAAEDIPAGATQFKCCPPIRERSNREKLWDGLRDGVIDLIVSDHSPCPASLKLQESGDFLAAWGGIASLQLRLPIVWTEAKKRGFTLRDLAQWLSLGPATQVKLQHRKGSIAVGNDADLIIWDPLAEFKVDAAKLEHQHKITPYQGESLYGVVNKTFLRGRKIYDGATILEGPSGQMLLQ